MFCLDTASSLQENVQEFQKRLQVTSQVTSTLICQLVFSTRLSNPPLFSFASATAPAVTGHQSLH